jgi:hypothetical protein
MDLVATYLKKANESRGRDARPRVAPGEIAKLPERSPRTILGGSAISLSTAFDRSRRRDDRGGSGITGHGQPITVTETVPIANVSWLPSPIFMKNATMTSSATMRRETPI